MIIGLFGTKTGVIQTGLLQKLPSILASGEQN